MRARQPGESALLLLDAVDLLARANVPYAVIGAMAASVHGVVRASVDADAVLAAPVHELPNLEREFRGAGFADFVNAALGWPRIWPPLAPD